MRAIVSPEVHSAAPRPQDNSVLQSILSSVARSAGWHVPGSRVSDLWALIRRWLCVLVEPAYTLAS
eukprot:1630442-Alexandrium_andersonii.AAC.1